jgi:hypothetical protein
LKKKYLINVFKSYLKTTTKGGCLMNKKILSDEDIKARYITPAITNVG